MIKSTADKIKKKSDEVVNTGTQQGTQQKIEGGMQTLDDKKVEMRIGLALSGGGFRASLFHLGVIRRLEELGIMEKVDVVSCVSGGSIIGAFYLLEMEKYLQEARCKNTKPRRIDLFEKIARDFISLIQKDIRSRALVFSPFFHPLEWMKSLMPGHSRTEILVREYDDNFFHLAALNELPSTGECASDSVRGPKLILNTTSLQDGRRIAYFRTAARDYMEMIKLNQNFEKLSKVVAASSAVPGIIPPVRIGKELLVDGGVSDNQGILPFISYYDQRIRQYETKGEVLSNNQEEQDQGRSATGQVLYIASLTEISDMGSHPLEPCDVIIVSDASGQMEQLGEPGTSPLAVLKRAATIQGFQIRNRNIDLLVCWKKQDKGKHEFAFIHLFRDLKDQAKSVGNNRVPSDYIPELGRIRTDLDQFSNIEADVLMYHGYTLIDYQLRAWCHKLLDWLQLTENDDGCNSRLQNEKPVNLKNEYKPAWKPKLFKCPDGMPFSERRERRWNIKRHLEAGSKNLLLARMWKLYGVTTSIIVACASIMYLSIVFALYYFIEPLLNRYLCSKITSDISNQGFNAHSMCSPILKFIFLSVTAAFCGYILSFLIYTILHKLYLIRSKKDYENIKNLDKKHSQKD